jgi:hypothetical protein
MKSYNKHLSIISNDYTSTVVQASTKAIQILMKLSEA